MCTTVGTYALTLSASPSSALLPTFNTSLFREAEAVDAQTPGQFTLENEASALAAAQGGDAVQKIIPLQSWCVARGYNISGHDGMPPTPG